MACKCRFVKSERVGVVHEKKALRSVYVAIVTFDSNNYRSSRLPFLLKATQSFKKVFAYEMLSRCGTV